MFFILGAQHDFKNVQHNTATYLHEVLKKFGKVQYISVDSATVRKRIIHIHFIQMQQRLKDKQAERSNSK